MQQSIPVFFSCLLEAFELNNAKMEKKPTIKKNSLNMDGNNSDNKSSRNRNRNTITNLIMKDKKALFSRLNVLFDLNKVVNNFIKMIKMNSPSTHMIREISKFLKLHKYNYYLIQIYTVIQNCLILITAWLAYVKSSISINYPDYKLLNNKFTELFVSYIHIIISIISEFKCQL